MFSFLDISHPLRCSIMLSIVTNIDFSSFSPFGLSFLCSTAVNVLADYNRYLMILRLCSFSFWFSFLLLYTQRGMYIFWFSFLLMVLVFCSCLELIWFTGVFSVVVFCQKSSLLLEKNFTKQFIIHNFWTLVSVEILLYIVAGKLFFLCHY